MISEKVIVGKDSEYPLNGFLTLPDDLSKPVPAVVMVHGSGSSNMDEKVMKLTPFKDLAEGLAQHGVASLRYDKRSFAHGRKMMKEGPITVKEETVDDAIKAVEMLKTDPRIDHDNVYILGHSMGAMLAPRIDAECGDVKGLIMMAGSPYRMEDIVIRQLKQATQSNSLMKFIGNLELKIFGKKFDGLYQMSEQEAKKKKFSGGVSLYYFQEMGRKTACDYLLEKSGISPDEINGYSNEEFTHTAVAALIAAGNADAGLGIYSAAKMYGLDFIPVCNETYEFLIDKEYLNNPMVQAFLEVLYSDEFKSRLNEMGGYTEG